MINKQNRKIDLIICAPINFDSPIVRWFIHTYHSLFNKVFYVTNGETIEYDNNAYYKFIKSDLNNIVDVMWCDTAIKCTPASDWRNETFHAALDVSTGDYIFLLEPDFYSTRWNDILDLVFNLDYSFFSHYMGTNEVPLSPRIWPSFWIVKRNILNKIDSNASVKHVENELINHDYKKEIYFDRNNKIYYTSVSNSEIVGYDHFDYINTQLIDILPPKEVVMLNDYFIYDNEFIHMRGLCEMFQSGFKKIHCTSEEMLLYRVDYCKKFYNLCKELNVNIFPEWDDVINFLINDTEIVKKV